jgi:hypothetical protein
LDVNEEMAPISDSDFSKAFEKSKELEKEEKAEEIDEAPVYSYNPSIDYDDYNSYTYQRKPKRKTRMVDEIYR